MIVEYEYRITIGPNRIECVQDIDIQSLFVQFFDKIVEMLYWIPSKYSAYARSCYQYQSYVNVCKYYQRSDAISGRKSLDSFQRAPLRIS